MREVRCVVSGLGIIFCTVLLGANGRKQAPAPPSAAEVLAGAEATAKAEHKKILLVFSASWCGPCQKLEKFLEDPVVRPVLDKSFVTAHLDVFENEKDQLHASSPGGELELAKLGGGGGGVPYFAMLDENGEWITDSKMPAGDGPPENLGYPSGAAQVDWFMDMIQKAAPDMKAEDVKTIRDFLEKHRSI